MWSNECEAGVTCPGLVVVLFNAANYTVVLFCLSEHTAGLHSACGLSPLVLLVPRPFLTDTN